MKRCLTCKRELRDQLLYCPFDGQLLVNKSERDNLVGTILEGKFRLDEKIGEGGMGKVYRATHLHLLHTVAIKVLHSHLASDEVALERFRREARAAIYIRHPNAVEVTDFGVTTETGVAYLVMEFLKGIELREKINAERQLDYEESFVIVQQTCAALHTAHTKGIIHRDLKPDNIWLLNTEEGDLHVKVIDFGIAKLKESADSSKLTQQGMIVGTPYYMSPEQCRGEELDARSDIYSLGVILYEMLTGQVPFQSLNPFGIAYKHANEAPRPLSELRPDIPEPIEAVVLRTLNKKRGDRQESATQLAQELEEALYASGIEIKAITTNTPGSTLYVSSLPYKTPGTQAAVQANESAKPGSDSTPNAGSRPGDSISTGPGEGARATPARLMGITVIGKSGSMSREQPLPFEQSLSFGRLTIGSAVALAKENKLAAFALAAAVIAATVFTFWVIRGRPATDTNAGKTTTSNTIKPPPAPEGMVYVPGGKFDMGSSDERSGYAAKPAHEVPVKEFFLDANEVTNEQYYKFVVEKGHAAPSHWVKKKYPPGEANLPVYNVSWEDARDYARWAGKRLPTEAEWEYAARGDKNLRYPWGNDPSESNANLRESGRNRPVAVNSYPDGRSWCGANDMVGNVAEWVDENWRPYSGNRSIIPDLRSKIYRGGDYTSARDWLWTTERAADFSNKKLPAVGFRCAQDVKR